MNQSSQTPAKATEQASLLRAAMRDARIEAAERAGVVVDLRDAELARLEILNEALDPVFAEVPAEADVFDRGLSKGDPPRLWVDMVAHVVMGHDKRVYRFVQDTRLGRKTLAESAQIEPIVTKVTQYIARRMVERDRSLAVEPWGAASPAQDAVRWWRGVGLFASGAVLGASALLAIAWLAAR